MKGTRPQSCHDIVAPQAQLFETGKDRRVSTEALFKQVVKFEQIDPLWFILGENKGGPYCCKIEIACFLFVFLGGS